MGETTTRRELFEARSDCTFLASSTKPNLLNRGLRRWPDYEEAAKVYRRAILAWCGLKSSLGSAARQSLALPMRPRENLAGRATLCGAGLESEFRIGSWNLVWGVGFLGLLIRKKIAEGDASLLLV